MKKFPRVHTSVVAGADAVALDAGLAGPFLSVFQNNHCSGWKPGELIECRGFVGRVAGAVGSGKLSRRLELGEGCRRGAWQLTERDAQYATTRAEMW